MKEQLQQQAQNNYIAAKEAAREALEAAKSLAAEIYGWSMKPVDRGQVIMGTPEYEAVCSTAKIAEEVAIHEADLAYYTAMVAAEEAYLAVLKQAEE